MQLFSYINYKYDEDVSIFELNFQITVKLGISLLVYRYSKTPLSACKIQLIC